MAEIKVVFGPPGTGKTTRLLGLMREAVDAGVAPERIGFISFTNAAVDEARERLGLKRGQNRVMCTIHAFAHRNSADSNSAAMTMEHEREVLHSLLRPVNPSSDITQERDRRFVKVALAWRAAARLGKPTVDIVNENPGVSTEVILAFLDAREKFKREHALVDFDEMVDRFLKDGVIPRLDLLFVDEAQDMDAQEWRLVSHLYRHAECLRARSTRICAQALRRDPGAELPRPTHAQRDRAARDRERDRALPKGVAPARRGGRGRHVGHAPGLRRQCVLPRAERGDC